MAGKYGSEYEFYPSEDKYEGDCHRYCGKDHNGLSDQDLSSIELRQNPYQRDKYTVTLVFTTAESKRDYRAETVKGLLSENAGMADAKIKNHGNASGFSVEMDNLSQQDLMRMTVALAQAAPKGKSDYFYPVLGTDVAEQVVSAELGRLKMSPVEAGLVSVSIDEMSKERAASLGIEKPVSYVDVALAGYPLSPVAAMREDGVFAEAKGKPAMQVNTMLTARDGQMQNIMNALQSAGVRASRAEGASHISVQAPSDTVAQALQKAGMMPAAVVDAVKSAADKAHPGQAQVNADIIAAGVERARKVSAPAAKL